MNKAEYAAYEKAVEADSQIRKTIIDACAWMLWAQAYIDWAEDKKDAPRPSSGGEWDPFVPSVPANVQAAAVKLVEKMEKKNDASVDVLYQRAVDMPGKHWRESTAERFGNCLGYQAVGAGVSWADDHPDPKYQIPHMGVYTNDGETADICLIGW